MSEAVKNDEGLTRYRYIYNNGRRFFEAEPVFAKGQSRQPVTSVRSQLRDESPQSQVNLLNFQTHFESCRGAGLRNINGIQHPAGKLLETNTHAV